MTCIKNKNIYTNIHNLLILEIKIIIFISEEL